MKYSNENFSKNRIILLFILTLVLLPGGVSSVSQVYGKGQQEDQPAVQASSGRQNILPVRLRKEDGSYILTGPEEVLELNSDIEFIPGPGCADYEFCISRDSGKTYSRYRSLKGATLRLRASENRQSEGIWCIRFRGLDNKKGIVSESITYRFRFDLTLPEVKVFREANSDAAYKLAASDYGSGIKSIEVKSGGEILYRSTEYQEGEGQEEESAVFEVPPEPGASRLVSVLVLDFAGNQRQITQEIGGGDTAPAPGSLSVYDSAPVFFRLLAPVFEIAGTPKQSGILSGLIVAALTAGEILTVILRFSPLFHLFEKKTCN